MTTYYVGTNTIEDCEHVIVIGGTPLFSCELTPDGPVVSFVTSSPPALHEVRVSRNVVQVGGVLVTRAQQSVSICLGDAALLELTQLDNGRIGVGIDLRRLGLNLYTDAHGLYIGGAQLSRNVIKGCKAAINIGLPTVSSQPEASGGPLDIL